MELDDIVVELVLVEFDEVLVVLSLVGDERDVSLLLDERDASLLLESLSDSPNVAVGPIVKKGKQGNMRLFGLLKWYV